MDWFGDCFLEGGYCMSCGYLFSWMQLRRCLYGCCGRREECVSDFLPEEQYNMLKESLSKRDHVMPDEFAVVVEAGFLVIICKKTIRTSIALSSSSQANWNYCWNRLPTNTVLRPLKVLSMFG